MTQSLKDFLRTLKTYISDEVPADMAACEFDCRELTCSSQDWETCPRRLQKARAIEQL